MLFKGVHKTMKQWSTGAVRYGGNLMLSPVYSSYQFCLSAQFRKSPEASHLKTTAAREFHATARFATRILKTSAPLNQKSYLLIDSIAEQTTIATNHSCETLAVASITKTRRQSNALNLLAIPIVNPRVSRVMKHRRCCTRLRAAAQCFQR